MLDWLRIAFKSEVENLHFVLFLEAHHQLKGAGAKEEQNKKN